MANISNIVREFITAKGSDAIPRMARMLLVDKTITDIDVKDSLLPVYGGGRSYGPWGGRGYGLRPQGVGYTALLYQAEYGTTGIMKWLLRQDPPPYIDVRGSFQRTPLMEAVLSKEDPEGKVRLLIEYGADRDLQSVYGDTALSRARDYNKNPAAVIDILENYRPDVSR